LKLAALNLALFQQNLVSRCRETAFGIRARIAKLFFQKGIPVEASNNSIKSLISLIFFLSTLFALAFLQMEERRQNYHILKLNRDLKKIMESRRSLEVKRLNALRPQKIEKEMQNRPALVQAGSEQIIHLPSISANLDGESMEPKL
jgi:hypothetical protein